VVVYYVLFVVVMLVVVFEVVVMSCPSPAPPPQYLPGDMSKGLRETTARRDAYIEKVGR
jgi:hypothetical protein